MQNTRFSDNRPILAEGVRSSAADMSRFLEMIRNRGVAENGYRVLSEKMINRMTEDHSHGLPIECKPNTHRPGQTYGLGVWRDVLDPTTGKVMVISHNGSSGFKGVVDNRRDATISVAAWFKKRRKQRHVAKGLFHEIRELLITTIPSS
jgi:CubicO group peptidase (beta-lactamase class C family)